MAGSSSLTPQSVSASRIPHRFTVAQANSTLPLVKRIVADIVRAHQQVTGRQAALEGCAKTEQPAIQKQLQIELEHLQDYVDELLDVGCELKDYRLGLIDFIGSHQGREIYLCWKLGEESIGFWHELDAGYGARKPIATLDEAASDAIVGKGSGSAKDATGSHRPSA